VEIERATSPVRLLPGEGLPPTPAPQLRPAFFPEGRHSLPLGAPPVTPAPYAAHQQAAPGPAYPIVGPTPAAFIAQPAVPYARTPIPAAAPYVESKPAAYPAPYAATPAPYVAKPAPYAATPAPYVAAATPGPYVASPAPSYVPVTQAPYATATPAPYVASAPAFLPKTSDVAAYSTLINFGPQEAAAVPPPQPPSAPVGPLANFNLPGPALDYASGPR
jgi:hypothetical protein